MCSVSTQRSEPIYDFCVLTTDHPAAACEGIWESQMLKTSSEMNHQNFGWGILFSLLRLRLPTVSIRAACGGRVCQLLGRLLPRSDLHHILYFHAIIANLWTKNWTLILKSLKSMGTAYSDCEDSPIFHILKQSMKPINILGFQAKYSETTFEILTRQNN